MKSYPTLLPLNQRTFDETEKYHFISIVKKLQSKNKIVLGSGIHRVTFGDIHFNPETSKGYRYVYKVPLNRCGIQANLREVELYKLDPKNKCRPRLIILNDIPVLIMEHLKVLSPQEKNNTFFIKFTDYTFYNPKYYWTKKLEDGKQVGRNRKGKIVVFDYPFLNQLTSTLSLEQKETYGHHVGEVFYYGLKDNDTLMCLILALKNKNRSIIRCNYEKLKLPVPVEYQESPEEIEIRKKESFVQIDMNCKAIPKAERGLGFWDKPIRNDGMKKLNHKLWDIQNNKIKDIVDGGYLNKIEIIKFKHPIQILNLDMV